MQKQIIATGFAVLSFLLPLKASAQDFEDIYVFGDSLSDVGNVFNVTKGVYPPSSYYQGRLSNGPVWVEYLATKLGATSTNFAFSGSSTRFGNAVFPSPLPGLLTQIGFFIGANSTADPKALYIVWAGSADYLFGDVKDANGPVNNLSLAVTLLYVAGARNIMVVNLPDLGKLPRTRFDSQISSSLDALTEAHNSGLTATLNFFSQKPGINIIPLDVDSLFDQAIAEPAKFGLINVTDSCLVNLVPCANPNEYLFWDEIHPTTAAHKLVGELAFSALKPKPVAEPSADLGAVLVLRK